MRSSVKMTTQAWCCESDEGPLFHCFGAGRRQQQVNRDRRGFVLCQQHDQLAGRHRCRSLIGHDSRDAMSRHRRIHGDCGRIDHKSGLNGYRQQRLSRRGCKPPQFFFDAAATAADGVPYRNTYTWYFFMRNGKVTKAIAFFDTREFDDFWQRVKPK